jgi:hypothetical protein
MSHEEVDGLVGKMMGYYRRKTNFPQWRDAVLQHRAHEDYDRWRSRVKLDFRRKWYHTRAKVKVLDFVQAGEEPSYSPADGLVSRMDAERFISRLDETNRQIVSSHACRPVSVRGLFVAVEVQIPSYYRKPPFISTKTGIQKRRTPIRTLCEPPPCKPIRKRG